MDIASSYPVVGGKYGDTSELHQLLMRYIWGPGANVAIILVLYTYRKWWTWVHGLFFFLATITTLVTSVPILITTGMLYPDVVFHTSHNRQILYSHYAIGVTCLVLMTVVTGIGFINRTLYMASVQPKTMRVVKWIHRLGGYAVMILCKANYYIMLKPDQVDLFIIFDSILIPIFILRRLYFPKMGTWWRIAPKFMKSFKQVKSLKELDQSKSYVVFANFIYDAQPLKNNHPGGYKVIDAITNREVDRFLYGVSGADQYPEVHKRAHSYKSFTLLGQPLAQIQIPQAFSGFDKAEIQCTVVELSELLRNNGIFVLTLAKKNGTPFRYNKYRQICQLGRFYSLTLNNKVTRLYTTVNFLLEENMNFLQKYLMLPQKSAKRSFTLNYTEIENENAQQADMLMPQQADEIVLDEEVDSLAETTAIPVMFRVYSQGKFTKKITDHPVNKIILSCQRGEGLQLAHTLPGKIIMVAGGTGLFTFSDLIDLLYKEQLMIQRPETKNIILDLSPILRNSPFEHFTFELFLGLNQLQDIHQVTFEQLLYLADCKRIKVTFKISDKQSRKGKESENIRFVNEGFEVPLGEAIDRGGVSRVLISGPPRMNSGISSFIRQNYHQSNLYLIV